MLAIEVVSLPVVDVDRALAFYTERVGFALDVDYRPTDLATDLAADHVALTARGVPVGPIRHKDAAEDWVGGFRPGLDPERRDYASFADFSDPDGNTWTLQERGHRH